MLPWPVTRDISHSDKCPCGTGPQTPNHILQSCPTFDGFRHQTWPSPVDAHRKLWGPVETLRQTVDFSEWNSEGEELVVRSSSLREGDPRIDPHFPWSSHVVVVVIAGVLTVFAHHRFANQSDSGRIIPSGLFARLANQYFGINEQSLTNKSIRNTRLFC